MIMKRFSRKIMWPVLATGAVVLGACWCWQREPAWQGRRLGEWLARFDQVGERKDAAAAIRGMGPRALPGIIHELKTHDSPWKKKFFDLINKQKVIRFQYASDGVRRERAVQACEALGPLARPAIPALGAALGHGSGRALQVLKGFGAEAVPSLATALTNAQGCVSPYGTALALGAMKFQARLAVTNLAWELGHYTIAAPRSASARALAQISLSLIEDEHQPDCGEVVFTRRILLQGLSNTNSGVRHASASALAILHTNATEATTPLVGLLDDADASVRASATNALRAIAPQALTFAPPQSAAPDLP
jgi:hypothetical protein